MDFPLPPCTYSVIAPPIYSQGYGRRGGETEGGRGEGGRRGKGRGEICDWGNNLADHLWATGGGWEPPVSCMLTSSWGPSSVFPSEPLPVPGPIRCSKQALDLFILPCPQPAGNTCRHLLRSMGSTDQTQQRNGHTYDFLFVSLDTSHFRGHPSFAHIDIFLTILPVLFIHSHSSLPNLSVQTPSGLPFHDQQLSSSSGSPRSPHVGASGTWKHTQTLALSPTSLLSLVDSFI